MADVTLNDLLVAIRVVEAKQDAMMKQLDELSKTSDQHWKRINDIETEIALLKQRQGPSVHWSSWVAVIVGALGFIAAFVTWVVK